MDYTTGDHCKPIGAQPAGFFVVLQPALGLLAISGMAAAVFKMGWLKRGKP